MGGYGSGWHGGTHGRAEARPSTDDARRYTLRDLRPTVRAAEAMRAAGRRGAVASGSVTWRGGTGAAASVGFRLDAEDDGIVLWLDYTFAEGSRLAGRPVSLRVPLDVTLGGGGARRHWMRCPGARDGEAGPPLAPCGRRVGVLYLPPGARRFACRACHGLTYQSCRESRRFDGLFRSLAAQMGTDAATVREALRRL